MNIASSVKGGLWVRVKGEVYVFGGLAWVKADMWKVVCVVVKQVCYARCGCYVLGSVSVVSRN